MRKTSATVASAGTTARRERSASPPLSAPHVYKARPEESPRGKARYGRQADSPSPARRHDVEVYYAKPRGRKRSPSPEEEFVSPAGSHILDYFENERFADDGDDGYAETEDSGGESTYETFPKPKYSRAVPHDHDEPGRLPDTPSKKSSYVPRKGAGRKWTAAKIQHLCFLWEDERHLYDASDPNYKNVRMRDNSHDWMAAILDMDGTYFIYLFECTA